jgi:hypothetical protein
MFGFGNAEAAILQCAKELLENSMDALKERGLYEISRGTIKISITGNASYGAKSHKNYHRYLRSDRPCIIHCSKNKKGHNCIESNLQLKSSYI